MENLMPTTLNNLKKRKAKFQGQIDVRCYFHSSPGAVLRTLLSIWGENLFVKMITNFKEINIFARNCDSDVFVRCNWVALWLSENHFRYHKSVKNQSLSWQIFIETLRVLRFKRRHQTFLYYGSVLQCTSNITMPANTLVLLINTIKNWQQLLIRL